MEHVIKEQNGVFSINKWSGKWGAVAGMGCDKRSGTGGKTILRLARLICGLVLLSRSQLLRLTGGRARQVQRLLGRSQLLGLVGGGGCK
jgi:hypothetical protein